MFVAEVLGFVSLERDLVVKCYLPDEPMISKKKVIFV